MHLRTEHGLIDILAEQEPPLDLEGLPPSDPLDWVAALLAGLGRDFTVLRPAGELRAALAELAARVTAA